MPHPYEPKMNLRLQSTKANNALSVLRNSLTDLEKTSDILDDEFRIALETHKTSKGEKYKTDYEQ